MRCLPRVLWMMIASLSVAFANEPVRLIAEFEPTGYVWFQWYEGTTKGSPPLEDVSLALLKTLTPKVKVRLFLDSRDQTDAVLKRLQAEGIDTSKIHLRYEPPQAAITDPAPVFLETPNGLATIDFAWNNYGIRKAGHPKTATGDRFDRDVAKALGVPVLKRSELVWEGGGMDHNGQGTMIFAEAYFFDRNPGWTKDKAEKELADTLGIKQVIWLKEGPVDDGYKVKLPGGIYPYGTGGHADEFVRFADANTILLAQVSEEQRRHSELEETNYQRLEENYQILKQARTLDGKPFNIIRVPTPEMLIVEIPFETIESYDLPWFPGAKPGTHVKVLLPRSYLNFLIVNDMVITAKYGQDDRSESFTRKDEAAKAILQRAFPGKTIVQLPLEALNHMGGGIHCYSYNEPAIPRGK